MDPSISILPSFHDKGPVPISPYPGLSPAKRLKNGFVSGFISKKLNYVKDLVDNDDNDIEMETVRVLKKIPPALLNIK